MPLPQIPPRCYPCFHGCHLAKVQEPNTAQVEALGAAVLAADAAARADLLPQFIQQVCHWGGGLGPLIATKVLNPANNPPALLLGSFDAAINALAAGNILTAINEIVGLYGFGISFGSKQLRMLRPDICGVLDTLVCGAGFGYVNSPESYVQYCLDCSAQAAALNAGPNFTSTGQPWNAGSVDMAVFARIRNRSINRPWTCRCAGDGHSLSGPCTLGAAPHLEGKRGSVSVSPRKEENKDERSPRVVDQVFSNLLSSAPAENLFIQHMEGGGYFALKRACGPHTRNMGALEESPQNLPDGTLNAKKNLVDEIAAKGGNFCVQPEFHPAILPLRPTRRVNGQNYIGWREFGNIDAAIQYLRIYFTVRACDKATRQALVDHGGPLLP